jgi:hypothetical protein
MFSVYQPDSIKSVWNYPNILAQKFPAEEFTATVKISFKPNLKMKDLVWLFLVLIMRLLSVIKKNDGIYIVQSENINADKNKNEIEDFKHTVSGNEFYLKVKVSKGVFVISVIKQKKVLDIFQKHLQQNQAVG